MELNKQLWVKVFYSFTYIFLFYFYVILTFLNDQSSLWATIRQGILPSLRNIS